MSKLDEEVDRFHVQASELVDKVKEIVAKGNARNVRIIQDGKVLLEIPLTVGVGVGVVTILVAPVLAALGALGALLTECTIEVDRGK